jgi:hypothetical protein
MSRIHNHKDPHKPRRQSGHAGKFKKFHQQLTFTNRSQDASLGLLITEDESFDSNTVTIQSNIPIDEDRERELNYVISSRVHLFEVYIHAVNPLEYMALIDIVYADTGETVRCVTSKHYQKLILDNQNTSRFEIQDEDDNPIVGMHSAKASFAVKIRETSRFHVKPNNIKKNKKSMIRQFVFRISIFRCAFASQSPVLERVHVSDSLTFYVTERKQTTRDNSATTNKQSKKKRSRTEGSQLNDKVDTPISRKKRKQQESSSTDEKLKINDSFASTSCAPSMDDFLEKSFNELDEVHFLDNTIEENHHEHVSNEELYDILSSEDDNHELDFIREDQSPIINNETSSSLSLFDPDTFLFNL